MLVGRKGGMEGGRGEEGRGGGRVRRREGGREGGREGEIVRSYESNCIINCSSKSYSYS